MDEDLSNELESTTASGQSTPLPPSPGLYSSSTSDPFQPLTPVLTTKKSKKNPALIILLTIFAISIVAAVIVCSIIFLAPSPNSSSGGSAEVDPLEGEAEITDEETKTKLQTVVANMFGGKNPSAKLVVTSPDYFDTDLYNEGTISIDYAIETAIKTLDDSLVSPLNPAAVESVSAILAQKGYEDFDTSSIKTIPADPVVENVRRIFGISLDKTTVSTNFYLYDPTFDFFFAAPADYDPAVIGIRYYYLSGYTKTESAAFVFVTSALYDKTDGKVYCRVFNKLDSETLPEVCATITAPEGDDSFVDNFALDETNYKDYETVRFEFKNNADGEYEFLGTYPVSD